MKIFIAVRHPDIAIFKLFLFRPQAERFITDWNHENPDNQLHLETYDVEQTDPMIPCPHYLDEFGCCQWCGKFPRT